MTTLTHYPPGTTTREAALCGTALERERPNFWAADDHENGEQIERGWFRFAGFDFFAAVEDAYHEGNPSHLRSVVAELLEKRDRWCLDKSGF